MTPLHITKQINYKIDKILDKRVRRLERLLMDTVQILCTLRNVKSFLGVFPSDFLTHSITRFGSIIINTYPHTEKRSHWLAIHFEPKSPVFSILTFTVSSPLFLPSNILETQLHGLGLQHGTTAGSNQHRLRPILLRIYPVHRRRLHPEKFMGIFTTNIADQQINEIFNLNSDLYARNRVVLNAARTFIKGTELITNLSFLIPLSAWMEVVIDYEFLEGRQGEGVIKDLSIAAQEVLQRYIFGVLTAWDLTALRKTGWIGITTFCLRTVRNRSKWGGRWICRSLQLRYYEMQISLRLAQSLRFLLGILWLPQ